MVSETVVDVFEAVEIDERDGEPRAEARCGQQCLLEPVLQQGPVREPRERVVVGLALDAGLVEPALGDVLDGALVTERPPVLAEHQA